MERYAFRIGDRVVDGGELLERGALAAFSALAVVLPVLDISISDAHDDMLLHDFRLLGAAAYLLPMVYGAGLCGVFVRGMRQHMRFIDLAGMFIAAVAVLRIVYSAASAFLPMPGMAAADGLQVVALAGIHLSYGSMPLLFLLLGSIWQLRKSWRG